MNHNRMVLHLLRIYQITVGIKRQRHPIMNCSKQAFYHLGHPNWLALSEGLKGKEVSEDLRLAILCGFSWEMFNGQLFDLAHVGEAFVAAGIELEGLERVVGDLTIFDQTLGYMDVKYLIHARSEVDFRSVLESGYPDEVLHQAMKIIEKKYDVIMKEQEHRFGQNVSGSITIEELAKSALNLTGLLARLQDNSFRDSLYNFLRQRGYNNSAEGIKNFLGLT